MTGPKEGSPRGRIDRLPRGLRGLARLAAIGLRLDRVVENQDRLGAQVHQLGRRTKDLFDGLDHSRQTQDRLGAQLRRQNQRTEDALGATNQQKQLLAELKGEIRTLRQRLGQSEREASALRERLEAFEAYIPRLRASRAPVGSGKLGIEATRAEISKVEHWYHRIRVAPGVVTPGYNDSDAVLEALGLPDDLSGMRLLDVGARDGYFSFVAEARGADVLAVDSVSPELTGFSTAVPLMGSSAEYRTMNVYDLDADEVGTFDAILFLGVLYHLRDPMLALDRLWDVANPGATIWVESHAIDRGFIDPATGEFRDLASVAPGLAEVPIAQFFPKGLLPDFTNWWGPNLACLEAMVGAAGFEVQRSALLGTRAVVVAHKKDDDGTAFYRRFDRDTATGEEGMVWEKAPQWNGASSDDAVQVAEHQEPALERAARVSAEEAREAVSRVEHWYHRIRVAPGVVTPGYNDSDAVLEALGLPDDLSGMRLLDVGARDGYFSFVAEARGADVLAVDSVDRELLEGFATASALLGSSVELRTTNVYDLDADEVGTFDAILFLGVLYHLRDPMLALDRLWDVANPGATIWVESHAIDRGLILPETDGLAELASVAPELVEVPIAQFYPEVTLGNNFTNWWGPNLACLEAMVEAAGFGVQRSTLLGARAIVAGRKVEDEETILHRNTDRGVIPSQEDWPDGTEAP